MRRGVVDLVQRLHEIEGIESLALTTNATLLPRFAAELRDAGLERINVSLDSLDPEEFAAITRGGKLEDALAGLDAAFENGFSPVKLNVVVVRSLKQDLLGFAKMSLGRPLHVRFIEYMPLGDAEEGSGCHSDGSSAWTAKDSVPSEEVIERLSAEGVAAGLGELLPVEKRRALRAVGARRGTIGSRIRKAPSASSRRCRTTSVRSATGFGSPLTADCDRACSATTNSTCARCCGPGPMRTFAPSCARRSASSPRTTPSESAPTARCHRSGAEHVRRASRTSTSTATRTWSTSPTRRSRIAAR